MNDQTLDQFLTERTAKAMKRIEEEIYAEVSDGICAFFGTNNVSNLTEEQIEEVSDAQKSRDKGFIKLGYNLVLKLQKWIERAIIISWLPLPNTPTDPDQ